MIVIFTLLAIITYAIVAVALTPVAIVVLGPIAHLLSIIVSQPVAEERGMGPGERQLYYLTGKNFFLMLFMIVLYFLLAWITASHVYVWPIAIYVVAAVFALSYWIFIASSVPAWTGRR